MDEREELHDASVEGAQSAEQTEAMEVQDVEQAGKKPEEPAVEQQELSEKTEEDSQEGKGNIGEELKEGEKPRKKKSCLGCLGNIVIAVAVLFLLIKGWEWLGHLTAPEENNSAATKARTYDFWYNQCAGKINFGGDSKIAFGKRVLPLLDKFMLEDEKSTVGNDEINTILSTDYTIDDEAVLAAYTGRKVKLTGKIIYKDDRTKTIQFATDVNFNPDAEGAEWPRIFLNCDWVEEKPDMWDCVEVEGMLIVDPYDFSSKERMTISVQVRKVSKADYLALGGDPANLFMNQETELLTSVEQKGITFDILGVSVDAATGRTYVKYQVSGNEELQGRHYDLDILAAKGNLLGMVPDYGSAGQSSYGSIMINEEAPNYVAQIAPGENQVSIVICGYNREDAGERIVEVNPDAEIFMRVDIPSESWTIVE